MIINNFDVMRVFTLPAETNPILFVYPNAVLPGAVAFENFQAIAGRQSLSLTLLTRPTFNYGEFATIAKPLEFDGIKAGLSGLAHV